MFVGIFNVPATLPLYEVRVESANFPAANVIVYKSLVKSDALVGIFTCLSPVNGL